MSIVTSFWRYLEAGAFPAALDLYQQDVIETIGDSDLGGAWALQQSNASATQLHVVDLDAISRGTLVLAEGIPATGPKSKMSFLLRREDGEDGRWQIVYDTFTASALRYYVQLRTQRRVDPSAKQPSPEALAAADRAVARFREAALEST